MKQIFLTLPFLLCAILTSCYPDRTDTAAVREEMVNRKIRIIKDADILSQASIDGKVISDKLIQLIDSTKKNAIKTKDLATLEKRCDYKSFPIVDSMEVKYAVKVSRQSKFDLPYYESLDSLGAAQWEAFQYNVENKVPFGEIPPLEAGQEMIYLKPILADSTPLICSGPNNSANLVKPGDLLGIWVLKFNKKELIKRIQ